MAKNFGLGELGLPGMVIIGGVILSLLLTFMPTVIEATTATMALALLGLIGGIVSINVKEKVPALLAALVLVVVPGTALAAIPTLGSFLITFLSYVTTFMGALAIVVGLGVAWALKN